MKKQIFTVLLMALAAILLMTIACGSSDEPTEPPGATRSGNDTSDPASNNAIPIQTNDQDSNPANDDHNRPQVVNTPQLPGAETTPWPTPAPTRTAKTKNTATSEPTEDPEEDTTTISTEPEPRQDLQHPPYDGASPLIHVFFDQPWLIMPNLAGQTLKLDLKGLTEDGATVSIEDPGKWGITIEQQHAHALSTTALPYSSTRTAQSPSKNPSQVPGTSPPATTEHPTPLSSTTIRTPWYSTLSLRATSQLPRRIPVRTMHLRTH